MESGFGTKATTRGDGDSTVVTRLAIEELEAWFFGDVAALCAAYPGVSPTLAKKARFRDPDAILGGTAETLLQVRQEAGHYRAMPKLPKMEVARRIGEHMDPTRNRSRSFRVFWDTIIAL